MLTKIHIVKAMVFPVVIYACESWTLKKAEYRRNWCFSTVVQKTLDSPLDCKEVQPVHPKGNQSWIFIGRTDAEAETPVLCPLDEKRWLIWTAPDAGKHWRQKEKGMTEDEMVGWHHWLNGHEFEQVPGIGAGLREVHGFTKSQTRLSDWTAWALWKMILVTWERLHWICRLPWIVWSF